MPIKSKNRIVKISLYILSVSLLTSGMLLLFPANWKIAVGVLLLIWGNNVDLIDRFEKNKEDL